MNNIKTAEDFKIFMSEPENWKPTHKVSYFVWAKEAPIGQHIYNVIEGSLCEAKENKNIVISGTKGEQWIVGLETIEKSYQNYGDTMFTGFNTDQFVNNGWTLLRTKTDNSGSLTVYAIQLPSNITDLPVQTSWGDVLYANSSKSDGHDTGDYIVAEVDKERGGPDYGDLRVVNHDVFIRTYDVSNFENEEQAVAEAPPLPTEFTTGP